MHPPWRLGAVGGVTDPPKERTRDRVIGAHTVDNGGIHMAALRAAGGGHDRAPALHRHSEVLRRQDLDPARAGDPLPGRAHRGRIARSTSWRMPRTCSIPPARTRPSGAGRPRACGRSWSDPPRSVSARVCFHPGAATGGDRAAAIERVARAITGALEAVPGATRVLVENTAGAGLTVGTHPGRGRRDPRRGAEIRSPPHRLRPRHLPPVRGGARHHCVGLPRSTRSSTPSRRRPGEPPELLSSQ